MPSVPDVSEIDDANAQVSTGIAGLDQILAGGLPQGHLFLIEGEPGSGKTTVGAELIRALLDDGLRVGVTAQSHAVIGNQRADEAQARGIVLPLFSPVSTLVLADAACRRRAGSPARPTSCGGRRHSRSRRRPTRHRW